MVLRKQVCTGVYRCVLGSSTRPQLPGESCWLINLSLTTPVTFFSSSVLFSVLRLVSKACITACSV